MRWVLLLFSLYREGNKGKERLGILPKVALLVFSRAGIWTYAAWLQSKHSPGDWIRLLASIPMCNATLDKWFCFSAPQFPHPYNGNNKSAYIIGLLWRLSENVYLECQAQCLPQVLKELIQPVIPAAALGRFGMRTGNKWFRPLGSLTSCSSQLHIVYQAKAEWFKVETAVRQPDQLFSYVLPEPLVVYN